MFFMFIKIKNLLNKSINRAGFSRQIEATQVVEQADKVLRQILSQKVYEKIKPVSFKNGALTIACLNSVAAQEVKLRQREIIAQINQPFKERLVTDLRFMG